MTGRVVGALCWHHYRFAELPATIAISLAKLVWTGSISSLVETSLCNSKKKCGCSGKGAANPHFLCSTFFEMLSVIPWPSWVNTGMQQIYLKTGACPLPLLCSWGLVLPELHICNVGKSGKFLEILQMFVISHQICHQRLQIIMKEAMKRFCKYPY